MISVDGLNSTVHDKGVSCAVFYHRRTVPCCAVSVISIVSVGQTDDLTDCLVSLHHSDVVLYCFSDKQMLKIGTYVHSQADLETTYDLNEPRFLYWLRTTNRSTAMLSKMGTPDSVVLNPFILCFDIVGRVSSL